MGLQHGSATLHAWYVSVSYVHVCMSRVFCFERSREVVFTSLCTGGSTDRRVARLATPAVPVAFLHAAAPCCMACTSKVLCTLIILCTLIMFCLGYCKAETWKQGLEVAVVFTHCVGAAARSTFAWYVSCHRRGRGAVSASQVVVCAWGLHRTAVSSMCAVLQSMCGAMHITF